MGIVNLYWQTLLEFPLGYLNADLQARIPWWGIFLYKVLATFFILWIAWDALFRLKRWLDEFFHRSKLVDPSDYEAHAVKNKDFVQELDAADHLESTLKPMLRSKNYARAAELVATFNQWERAAKYYMKAKDRQRAAENFARAGKTLKAAKLLSRLGDHVTAARFYTMSGNHLLAAKTHEKARDLPAAAMSFAAAGKPKESARLFLQYFQESTEELGVQHPIAEVCLKMLGEAGDKIPVEARRELRDLVADRLAAGGKYLLAAKLFQEAGNLARAGDAYARGGQFQEAAHCLREAGNVKESQNLMGRYFEAKQLWDDAGKAYAAAGALVRAADCYCQAKDFSNGGACYEQAKDFYRAGVAYIQVKSYEAALRVFKQIPEESPDLERARLLIGRSYFGLRQYDLCAAALENQLGGKVTQRNIEYFKMLGRAYAEVGRLEEALSVFNKIKAVSTDSKDVDDHISSIQVRLSKDGSRFSPTQESVAASRQQMSVVESALGKRYRFERELGRGGMGVVYQAHDTHLDRPVALKFLGSVVDESGSFRERFFREARTAARVTHANVVATYDIGEDMGKAYIAMEYVDGINLHQYLGGRGRLSPRDAVVVMRQVCAALDAVHRAGITHRDIKPENILISKEGLVKLMDFGLAVGKTGRLTQAGQILGTPCYMPPEQVRGEEVDGRSDIYALGLVFHEMLTGETYFLSGDILHRQEVEMPPPPSATVEGIPNAIDEIVLKCIAKDPDARYQSAAELAAALTKI